MTRCWKWDVTVLTSPQLRRLVKYAVIVLNRPVSQSPEFITDFWNNAAATITVDGGTLRWEKFLDSLPEGSRDTLKRQDFISGDFDSIPHDALEKFKKAGYKIIPTPDQDYTDFTKSLMELTKHCQQNSILMEHVVVLAQTSGRVDHVLGNIQTLFLAKDKHLLDPHTKLYILSDDSLSWLLLPGEHIINVPEEVRDQKRAWCSLVPIGEECESVTTVGLKWNLEHQTLKFGEVVSTSNTFSGAHEVKIRCSHPILWSMTIPIVGSE